MSDLIECQGEDDITMEDMAGVVGKGPASEFEAFLKVWSELPKTPEEIISKKVYFKGKPDRQYAVNGILASHFRDHPKKDNAEDILRYSYNLEEEFAVCLVKDCIMVNKAVMSSNPEFRKWTTKYQSLIL